MADTSDIRNGLVINFRNDLYAVVQFQHVKPGKGPAFVRTKLKSITSGKTVDNTFSSGEKFEVARVERRDYQFLYNDDTGYHFMENSTYEQIALQKEMINCPELLKEGQMVEIVYHTDTESPLSCELPQFVELEVTYTEPGMKGDTASGNTLKPATVETNTEVNVPLFINTGEKIKIDTKEKSYVERVKS